MVGSRDSGLQHRSRGTGARQASVVGRQRRRVQRDSGPRDRVRRRRTDDWLLRAGLERHAQIATGRRAALPGQMRHGRVSNVPVADDDDGGGARDRVQSDMGHVEGGRVDSVHTDGVRGRRHMRFVHRFLHIDPGVQERRDGGQPDFLVRPDRRHAADVRQRRAVRRGRHLSSARRVLRQAVRRVRQLLHCVLRHVGQEHDDRVVRLRLELHEPRQRLSANVVVRVHHVRAAGATAPVLGHTRHRAVV